MENRQNKPPKGGAASGHGGQKFHTDSEQAKLHKSKLRMESREERLNKARERLAKQKPPKKPGAVKRLAHTAGHGVHGFVHGKLYEVEHENVGTEGAHRSELAAESVYRFGRRKLRKAIREHPAKAAARAESRYIKATADYHSRKFAQEQPEAQSAAARLWHRHKLKREYQRKARETAKQTAKAAEQTASATERFVRGAAAFVKRHPVGTLLALGCLLVVLTLQSCMSSMVSVGNSTLAAIAASTYKAEDADMLGAEAAYSPCRGCVANTAHNNHTGSRQTGSFCLMTAQTIPARRLPLLWIETENNCPAASGHRGQRWGKVKGRRFCAVLSRFPTDNGKPSNLFTPLIFIGGFQMTEARVGYHKEVKTASFQGKSITVENLTPMLSPRARDKRKREIESCLYEVFVKYAPGRAQMH